jgi:hypothetical protein
MLAYITLHIRLELKPACSSLAGLHPPKSMVHKQTWPGKILSKLPKFNCRSFWWPTERLHGYILKISDSFQKHQNEYFLKISSKSDEVDGVIIQNFQKITEFSDSTHFSLLTFDINAFLRILRVYFSSFYISNQILKKKI